MDMPKEGSMYNFIDSDGSTSYLPPNKMANPYDKLELMADAFKMGHLKPEDPPTFYSCRY